jgi:hypothetical protein
MFETRMERERITQQWLEQHAKLELQQMTERENLINALKGDNESFRSRIKELDERLEKIVRRNLKYNITQ